MLVPVLSASLFWFHRSFPPKSNGRLFPEEAKSSLLTHQFGDNAIFTFLLSELEELYGPSLMVEELNFHEEPCPPHGDRLSISPPSPPSSSVDLSAECAGR